jgi:hypothetical protein
MKATTKLLNRFDGGVAQSKRATRGVRVCTNFDVFSDPNLLQPRRSSESGDSNAAVRTIRNFAIARRTGETHDLFGLGRISADNEKAKIFRKAVSLADTHSLRDDAWHEVPLGEGDQANPSFDLFVYYRRTGKLYGAHAARYIWTADPIADLSADAFENTHRDLTSFSRIAQGMVHPADDVLYIPYDNKIAKNDNGSWTNEAATIPDNFYISSITESGNFLAIAGVPLAGIGNSFVYFWNRDTSQTVFTDAVDWGAGRLLVIGEVDGEFIGISLEGADDTGFFTKLVFKRYVPGIGAVMFLELTNSATSPAASLSQVKQKIDNRLYFNASIVIDGVTREGVWSVGRGQNGEYSVVHEHTPNNDTALVTPQLLSFFKVGDYTFQGFISNNVYALTKTIDTEQFAHNADFETAAIYFSDDPSVRYKLKGVSIMHEPIPFESNRTVTVSVKVDGETSYTDILTSATDLSTIKSSVKTLAGANLPEGREFFFRIRSRGVKVAYLKMKAEPVGKLMY